MTVAAQSKLAELRIRTDRDLLVLIRREMRRLGTCVEMDERYRRLLMVKSLLRLVETRKRKVRALEAEVDALLAEPRALRVAC